MTEAEWLAGTDPAPMLRFLRRRGSDRKLRLFACDCCRSISSLFPTETYHQLIEVAEAFSDNLVPRRELTRKHQLVVKHSNSLVASTVASLVATTAFGVADQKAYVAARRTSQRIGEVVTQQGLLHDAATSWSQALVLKDIFGNPFRPVSLDPAWLAWHGGAAAQLAQAVYDDRDLPSGRLDAARLAVLADMLEEAGCSDADILGHLRGPGPHVRGCWPIDLILSKDR
jgi:hypothetical protein